MKRVVVSHEAMAELDEIVEYVAEHDGVDRALALRDRLHRAFRLIAEAPRAGVRKAMTPANIRWWSVVPYFVLYDGEADPVVIRHIYHAARNLPDLMD